jgi:hypothetical protein
VTFADVRPSMRCNAERPVNSLGASSDFYIGAVSLVIQHGPERAWDWSIAGTIRRN